MKIGILTFHWATNYGAVLQCYALQTFLKDLGHDVEVINYKPYQFDDTLSSFIIKRKFFHLKKYLEEKKKEKCLDLFRTSKLNQTIRVATCREVERICHKYDILISGSDQVLNSFFLNNGDGMGILTPTYYLGFSFRGKKIGYALSFGTIEYPQKEKEIASTFIVDFDAISVRENSGLKIVESMGWKNAIVVPDPTLLIDSIIYQKLADEHDRNANDSYYYNFFIRNVYERKLLIQSLFPNQKIIWNNDGDNYTLQGWLNRINQATLVITDSFHCMVMCLKLHTPFIVVTDLQGNVGMNDRFYTLLKKMELEKRIVYKKNLVRETCCRFDDIKWNKVDIVLGEYKQIGENFLNNMLKFNL